MKKVIILQKYLAPYRVPVFNMLAESEVIDLTVLYYGKREERRKWNKFPDKKFKEYQSRCLSVKKNYNSNMELPYALLGELRALKPDVIICAPDIGGITSILHGMLFGSELIIWSESTFVTEGNVGYLKKLLRKYIYSKANRFLVPGKLAEEYVKSFINSANVFYVNNSIEEELFKITYNELKNKFNKDKIEIVFSGSLISDKGIIELLTAYKKLVDSDREIKSNTCLRILGTGTLDVAEYCNDNIIIEGFCENPLYSETFKKSNIFVLPSYHDCNPLTVIEALFSGNILILSDKVGNSPEAIRGNGYVIPAHSVEEIEVALKTILTLPRTSRVDMAFKSLEIAKDFSMQRSVNGFLAAISSKINPTCSFKWFG